MDSNHKLASEGVSAGSQNIVRSYDVPLNDGSLLSIYAVSMEQAIERAERYLVRHDDPRRIIR